MKRIANRTAHIKPATREALMDQLALAADAQTGWQHRAESASGQIVALKKLMEHDREFHLSIINGLYDDLDAAPAAGGTASHGG